MRFNLPSLRSAFRSTRDGRSDIDDLMDDFFNLSNRLPRNLLTNEVQEFYPQLDISDTNS